MPIEMNAFFFRAGRGEAEDFGGGDGLSECENFWGDGLDFWEIGEAGFLDGSRRDPENYAIRGIFSRARAKGRVLRVVVWVVVGKPRSHTWVL